ncbi:MAG: Cys-tRNA(Pro) deacylase [Eubacteriales bacterium]
MKKNDEKTNVMRLLDAKNIVYDKHLYVDTDAISGVEIAEVLNQDPNHVFKTLVTVGASRNHFVFLVPVHRELDLKKAARAAGEKSIVMIKQKELLPLTGYIHGGCSPIGMKKQFPTFIDVTAEDHQTILFSAGKIGYQVEITLDELRKALDFKLTDLKVEEKT